MTPKVRDIIRQEADRSGYTFDDIIGPSRVKQIIAVRQYAMWRSRKETNKSYTQLGMYFKRDHTTVLHAVEKVESMPPSERGIYEPKPVEIKKRFITQSYIGSPCRKGHSGLRYAVSYRCIECERGRKEKYSYKSKYAHTLKAAE